MKEYRAWDKQDNQWVYTSVFVLVTNLGVMKLNPLIKEDNYFFLDKERFDIEEISPST